MLVQCQVPVFRRHDGTTIALTRPKLRLFRKPRSRAKVFTRVCPAGADPRRVADLLHMWYAARNRRPVTVRLVCRNDAVV